MDKATGEDSQKSRERETKGKGWEVNQEHARLGYPTHGEGEKENNG